MRTNMYAVNADYVHVLCKACLLNLEQISTAVTSPAPTCLLLSGCMMNDAE